MNAGGKKGSISKLLIPKGTLREAPIDYILTPMIAQSNSRYCPEREGENGAVFQ